MYVVVLLRHTCLSMFGGCSVTVRSGYVAFTAEQEMSEVIYRTKISTSPRDHSGGRSGRGAEKKPTIHPLHIVSSLRTVIVLVIGLSVCVWRWRYTEGTKIARMDPYSNPIAAHDVGWQQAISYW